jgi:hypothetical protein
LVRSFILNEEDKAEYDTQMAESQRSHNKYHGNPAEEDSDSELSGLFSSLFNSMEGGVMGTEMCGDSEVQVNAGSNSTVFGGDSEVKVSRYSRVLRKRAN